MCDLADSQTMYGEIKINRFEGGVKVVFRGVQLIRVVGVIGHGIYTLNHMLIFNGFSLSTPFQ